MHDIGDVLGMLDRDGALHLDDRDDYEPRREQADADRAYPIDFDRLAPEPADQPAEPPRGIATPRDVVDRVLKGGSPFGPGNLPRPDVLAWYQPIHFYAYNWGIFIRQSALVDLARDLAPRFNQLPDRRPDESRVAAMLRAALVYLFLHEQYHHKVESLSVRLHVVERRPVYPNYKYKVANVVAGSDGDLEEALANADAWHRLSEKPYSTWFEKDEHQVIKLWLKDLFSKSPPGYREAVKYLDRDRFDEREQVLCAQVQESLVRPLRGHTSEFGIATHLTHALYNLKQNIWTLVPQGQTPILPTLREVFPMALELRELRRELERSGFRLVAGAGKGSHIKYRAGDGRMIILPDKREVSRVVAKNTAHTLNLSLRDLFRRAR